ASLEVFNALDFAVPLRRGFDARDLAVGSEVRPGVFDTVSSKRDADFFEALIAVVVLPAVDLAVPVAIDFDANDTGAVHVAPRIDLSITVGIVFQQAKDAGLR